MSAETVLRCIECDSESAGLASGWRAYRVRDIDEDDGKVEILMYCPTCGEHEFGPFGLGDRDTSFL